MNIISFFPGDCLILKKPHPCGSNTFRVLRVGSEVRVVCDACGRDMTMDRIRLEKAIKKVIRAKESPQNPPNE